MKIDYRPDSILDAVEPFIIHGCNAQGAMGSGVAKVLFDRYPTVRRTYLAEYERYRANGWKFLGTIHSCPKDDPTDPHTIINAITQEFYGRDGKLYANYEAILDVFEKLNQDCSVAGGELPERAVAMPLIGCGLAGGDWKIVSEIIETTATNYQPVVYLNGETVPVG
jgi:O-acetyl-ADP-ribose deacetylase (regulator of RNase III)